jgi:hypothetical protein
MSLNLHFDCFSEKTNLAADYFKLLEVFLSRGELTSVTKYGGGKFRTDPMKEIPLIMPGENALYESDPGSSFRGIPPEITLQFIEDIVESPFALRSWLYFTAVSGRSIGLELGLWGTNYRGWPREAVSFVFDDGDIAKRWLEEDRELFLNGTYVRQDVAFERWIKSPDLAVGEYEIGPQYLHAGHSRNSDVLELFLRSAGGFDLADRAPRFTDVVVDGAPPLNSCMVFHRSIKGFAIDFLRIWAAINKDLDNRLMYPEFGWSELEQICDGSYPDPRYKYVEDKFTNPNMIIEITPTFIDGLLQTSGSVYHQRMRTLCAKIPQCAWFDFGKRGVAICMPPYVPLVNVYRVLAGLEIQ